MSCHVTSSHIRSSHPPVTFHCITTTPHCHIVKQGHEIMQHGTAASQAVTREHAFSLQLAPRWELDTWNVNWPGEGHFSPPHDSAYLSHLNYAHQVRLDAQWKPLLCAFHLTLTHLQQNASTRSSWGMALTFLAFVFGRRKAPDRAPCVLIIFEVTIHCWPKCKVAKILRLWKCFELT